MGKVTISLLGGFSAAVDGAPVPETAWRLKKARELVKLLALAPGHRMQREQAMDVLWRDRDPAAAANNLNQAVYIARRALDSEAIVVRDESLQLSADVDVDRLREAADAARRARTPAAYRAALDLYGGELLPENRYDDWAEELRDQLSELAVELADGAATASAEAARLPPLPLDASSFIGRERELSGLEALLRRTRLLTLAGTGGVGKTRLALELGRAVEPSHADGAALVELGDLRDARLVPEAVASTLEVRALDGQDLEDAVGDFLARRELLLILDNCEHLLAATASLAGTLLRGAPRLTILTTSREPLLVPGESVFRVPSLDIPDPAQPFGPDELVRYEAVRLFAERARAAAPGFAIDGDNAADVARICFRLDGLPLALELAAGRIGALGPAAIALRLDDRFRVLRTARHASPTRQQTLTATMEWSHDLLTPDERTLFRRLAVFAGGFELGPVEAVCGVGDLDPAGIADVLARLTEKSLVAVDEERSRERRYRLLETVHVYARARLAEAGEAEDFADRHAGWAIALAEDAGGAPHLDRESANLRAALDRLQQDAPDRALRLCVALWPFWMRRLDLHEGRRRFDAALAGTHERSTLRARALLRGAAIDFRSGALQRALALAEESLAVASEIADRHAEWRVLQFLGELRLAGDATEDAFPWLERALDLARAEGFAVEEAMSVYSIGVARWVLGDLAGADELVERSIVLFRALEGSSERILSPMSFAEIRTSPHGDRPALRMVFEDTLQPFVEISCAAAVGYAIANRAGLMGARGDHDRARMLLDESAERFEALRDERGRATVLVRRAYLDLAEGALDAAHDALGQALDRRRAHGDRRGVGLVLTGLALVATTAGEYARADRDLTHAREIFRRAGDRWGLASALWRTADLAFARDDLDEAERALEEARTVLAATGRERWTANTLAGLAEVSILRGDVPRARALLVDARGRYAARQDAVGVADVDAQLRTLR